MKKCTRVVIGVAVAGALAVGPVTAASAAPAAALGIGATSGGAVATSTPQEMVTGGESRAGGGGVWQWGSGATVWSNYFHGSRCHGSSVQGKTFNSSPNRGAGVWTYAKAEGRPFAVDYAYYRVC